MHATKSATEAVQPQTANRRKRTGRRWLGVLLLTAGLLWMMQLAEDPVKQFVHQVADLKDRLLMSTNNRALAQNQIQAHAAFVMNAETGETIFYKNDKEHMPPASTTKMMTALLALENSDPNERVLVGKEVQWTEADESRAGLQPGELMTWRELVTAMMLPSGNDAARTIAVQIGMKHASAGATREEAYHAFVELMNDRAVSLGMRDTQYRNPHGMHEKGHYTTANDLSKLAQEAMKNSLFREIVAEKQANLDVTYEDHNGEKTVVNRNQLLQPESGYYYEGAIGIKTGFTDQAGYCLVASADRDGRKIITIVLHSGMDEVWTDSHTLLDYGFKELGQSF